MKLERTSTVESLLGALSLGPMSGYQMRQFMEQSTANFWSESFGQIYPALKTMLKDGLVEAVEGQTADGHPAKKIYRATEKGQEHLRRWLGLPLRPHKIRHELLLKVFFGNQAAPGAMAEHVRSWQRQYTQDLQRYEQIQSHMESHCANDPGMPYWRMTVRYGIAEAHMVLTWCEQTLAELQDLAAETRSK